MNHESWAQGHFDQAPNLAPSFLATRLRGFTMKDQCPHYEKGSLGQIIVFLEILWKWNVWLQQSRGIVGWEWEAWAAAAALFRPGSFSLADLPGSFLLQCYSVPCSASSQPQRANKATQSGPVSLGMFSLSEKPANIHVTKQTLLFFSC